MKTILKHRLIVYLLLAIGLISLLTAVYFTARTVFSLTHKPPHFSRTSDVTLIADWMNISFISRMYRVPEPILLDSLDLPADFKGRISIKQIAAQRNQNPGLIIQLLQQTIKQFQQTHPQPSSGGK